MRVWIVQADETGWYEIHGEEPTYEPDGIGWLSGMFLDTIKDRELPLYVRRVIALKRMAICNVEIYNKYLVTDCKEEE